jgi:uncharacterized protein YecE (DUF72 family)
MAQKGKIHIGGTSVPNLLGFQHDAYPEWMKRMRIGTSAFTAAGWEGTFYPAGMKPRDFLTYYATKFSAVEIDSTYYRTPAASTVNGWFEKTPRDFLFAAKVPQVVTHEKVLLDCDSEFEEFGDRMDLLDDKLGPLLLQFPYFNRSAFRTGREFLERLDRFLEKHGHTTLRYAVEIRNKNWLTQEFAEVLKSHKVALAMIDQSWMPRPLEWLERLDPITAEFTYIRWLGDRKGIEERTKTWDKTIVDRTAELETWVTVLQKFVARNIKIFAWANNHYAGHAPATVKLFWDLWEKKK